MKEATAAVAKQQQREHCFCLQYTSTDSDFYHFCCGDALVAVATVGLLYGSTLGFGVNGGGQLFSINPVLNNQGVYAFTSK